MLVKEDRVTIYERIEVDVGAFGADRVDCFPNFAAWPDRLSAIMATFALFYAELPY